MARMVIALGGNALGYTPDEQRASIKKAVKSIVDLLEDGNEIILAHGNGPQVGMINLAFEFSASNGGNTPEMPFPESGAMSQGYIGYHLQNAIGEELRSRNINKDVATVITQVIVDQNDPSLKEPTKPIGKFYTKKEADRLIVEKGYDMFEDSGRGYRRVVPSPEPVDIAEKRIVKNLVQAGNIVIACGGGGIPVVKEGDKLRGIPAVIDKDFASEKLAELLEADLLVILTDVEQVSLNFGTVNEKQLTRVTTEEARSYCQEGHFGTGSMEPKVRAAVKFVEQNSGKEALITSLDCIKDGLKGLTGTRFIIKEDTLNG